MPCYANWQSGHLQTVVIVSRFDSEVGYQFLPGYANGKAADSTALNIIGEQTRIDRR